MSAEFHNLENSLKEFLIAAQTDAYNSKNINYYRYNNLKLYMDLKKVSQPHFIVRIGISESIYHLDNCEKMAGGLGSDERYIGRWHGKPSVKSELTEAWNKTLKFEPVQMKNDND